ncbi:MAG TPA: RDD family protein [Granulicella sp.]
MAPPQLPGLELTPKPEADTRAARIAKAVAERYENSPSYRAVLAAEAERAIQQAEAAAEIAARTAKAVVASQQQLLSELADWDLESAPAPVPVIVEPVRAVRAAEPPALTVRHIEEVNHPSLTITENAVPFEELTDEERLALEEEIAFRQSPVFEAAEEAVPLPANLIEFPRQLVAARKARPRLAEGPLREESGAIADTEQLRIFEVTPEQISTEITLYSEPVLPVWSSIRLDAQHAVAAHVEPQAAVSHLSVALSPAPLNLRLMAAAVDGCIVLGSFLGFVTVFDLVAGGLPGGQIALLGAAATLFTLAIVYQMLFFTLSEATPGMLYARIGLCTFSDDNPTRSAMRKRVVATLLAACPVGIGLLWAWIDEDGLGWHDRISRMYQRAY